MKHKLLALSLFCLCLAGCGTASDASKSADASSSDENVISSKSITDTSETVSGQDEITSVSPECNSEPTGETTTLMIYMIGSDLESGSGAATNDLEEITNSRVDLDYTNVVVYTGGSKKWHSDLDIPNDANTIMELTEDGFELLDTYESVSMGESSTLSDYINYVTDNYDTDNYALIMWDHGSGPLIGYGFDRLYDDDTLTLSEMKKALSDTVFADEKKLEFVGFDACLMSSAELICTMDDYAKYIVSSQEVEPCDGWNYSFLSACGYCDTVTLTKNIVNAYISACEEQSGKNIFFNSDSTLSVVDLSYGTELEDDINALFTKTLNSVKVDYPELASERIKTLSPGRASTGSDYDLVDMNSLMECMSKTYPEETESISALLEKMVIANGSTTDGYSGFSMYYPYYNKQYYTSSWKEVYSELGLFPSYQDYLGKFETIWLDTDMQEEFTEAIVPEIEEDGSISVQLTEEQNSVFASGTFALMRKDSEDKYTVIYESSNISKTDSGLLTADFDGKVIYIKDNFGDRFIPLIEQTDSYDNIGYYSIQKVWTGEENSLTNLDINLDVQLSVDYDTEQVTVKSVYETTDSEGETIEGGKREPVDLSDYNIVNFFESSTRYLSRDENGVMEPFSEWDRDDVISYWEAYTADGISFEMDNIYDDGLDYYIMFNISDVQGNSYGTELVPIELDRAPSEEDKITEVEVKENELCFYEDSVVSCEFEMIQDPITGVTEPAFYLINKTDSDISVKISDPVINNEICGDETLVSIYLDPHERNEVYLPSVTRDLSFASISQLTDFECSVTIRNYSEYYTILSDEKYHFNLSEDIEPRTEMRDLYGAKADSQILYEEDGIKISLVKMGMEPYDGEDGGIQSMLFQLKVENNSDSSLSYNTDALILNDFAITADNFILDELGPNESIYEYWTENLSYYSDYNDREIASISLVMKINDSEVILPVKLSEKGSDTEFVITGDTIQETEDYAIYSQNNEYSQWFGDIGFFAQNKTDEVLTLELSDFQLNGADITAEDLNTGSGCDNLSIIYETGTYKLILQPDSYCNFSFRVSENENLVGTVPKLTMKASEV